MTTYKDNSENAHCCLQIMAVAGSVLYSQICTYVLYNPRSLLQLMLHNTLSLMMSKSPVKRGLHSDGRCADVEPIDASFVETV